MHVGAHLLNYMCLFCVCLCVQCDVLLMGAFICFVSYILSHEFLFCLQPAVWLFGLATCPVCLREWDAERDACYKVALSNSRCPLLLFCKFRWQTNKSSPWVLPLSLPPVAPMAAWIWSHLRSMARRSAWTRSSMMDNMVVLLKNEEGDNDKKEMYEKQFDTAEDDFHMNRRPLMHTDSFEVVIASCWLCVGTFLLESASMTTLSLALLLYR